uniref:Ribokinase n=2 Tax=Hirondellea gigas TaxID=1518452 RepID=A0A2P2IDH1_9CRUS
MSKAIVVLGSCIVDNITYVSTFPRKGETVVGRRVATGCGGKGANQAVAAARLGGNVRLIGKVGDDSMGRFYLEELRRSSGGVDSDLVTVSKEDSTGTASITVDDAGENTIIIVPGANESMTLQELEAVRSVIEQAALLVCQCEVNMAVTQQALLIAKQAGVRTLMNAAPATAELPDEVIQNSHFFCVNETEAQTLLGMKVTGPGDAADACKRLVEEKGCHTAVITLGGQGCVYHTRDGHGGHVPTVPVTATDTTGAGDCFVGAMAYYLAEVRELALPEILRRCCLVAAVAVQHPGTQTSFPYKQQLPAELFS